ncbi:MAG: PepSY-like domain-containing protein [Chitinophagales bacterium]|nr:PepSY-like domain-containing protein [Bacteroidota bacterium]
MIKFRSIFNLIFLLFIYLTSCAKDVVLKDAEVPSEIKNYISTFFPDCAISKAVKDNDGSNDMYEVNLSCGYKLEFNKSKLIIDIDGKNTKLPDNVISSKLRNYVQTHYPSNYIVGWEIQNKKQKLSLNSDIDLIFDMQDNFVRIDD